MEKRIPEKYKDEGASMIIADTYIDDIDDDEIKEVRTYVVANRNSKIVS